MNAKEYLLQIKKVDMMINNKMEELKILQDLSMKTTPSAIENSGTSGGTSDKVGGGVAKMIDLQQEINKQLDILVSLKREIMESIDLLPPDMADIIYKRYFQYKPWKAVAIEMHYTRRWIYQLHGKALYFLQKKLPAK